MLTDIGFNTPGGYFEITDVTFPVACDDGTVGPDSALRKWSDMLLDIGKKIGRDLDAAKSYKEEMEKVGYTDIGVRVDVWPMNRWPKGAKNKEIGMDDKPYRRETRTDINPGAWNLQNVLSGLDGFTMATFTRIFGWTPEDVELFLVNVRKEMKDIKIHAYWNM